MKLPLTGRQRELQQVARLLWGGSARGVVLTGGAGVGKSRLATEALDLAPRYGWTSLRAVATRAAAEIPFGALAHVLPRPAETPADRLHLLQAMRDVIAERAARHPLVLAIDDAHLLDSASSALVQQIALTDACALVLTVRPDAEAPDSITSLWKEGVLERLELHPLTRGQVTDLASTALGGPLQRRLLHRLWRYSEGNPLYATEILQGWKDSGALTWNGVAWSETGTLPLPRSLRELIQTRLAGLTSEARHTVEILAASEPVSLDLLQRLEALDSFEQLESLGFAATAPQDQQLSPAGRLAHPIYREILLDSMPKSRLRQISRALADAAASLPVNARPDPLQLALWRLDSGDLDNPDVFVDAARRAQAAFDYALAERFARAALQEGERFDAQIILGESLTRQKRVEAAERAIAQATESAASDAERTRAAIAFANLLFFYSNRQREATRFLHEIRGDIADTDCQREIDATLSLFVGITGNLDNAVDLGVRATRNGAPDQPEGLPSLTASTIAQIMQGQVREPEVAVQRGLQSAEQLQGELSLWRHLLFGNLALLYYYSGRLREADDLTRDQYLDAIQQAEPMAGFWADVRAENLLLRGRIQEGLHLAEEGEPLLRQWDAVGMLPVTISRCVVFHAFLGDVASATAAMARLAPYHESEDARVRFAIGRARTWLAIAEGRLSHATDQALRAGDRAERDGMVVWTANLFHDIVRIGRPEAVAGRLAALAERAEAEMVHVQARHAFVLASADREGLQAVAEGFSRMGASLLAAEAYAQLSRVSTEQGHSNDAKVAAQRAVFELERCGPARTPALASLSGSLLTRREREIAHLAARGASSREIAQRLSLSIRTVDNHLGAIYAKFGIGGRNELSKAIGLSNSGLPERTAPS